MLSRVLEALGGTQVSAHCDLPCGVYDPAQARIEAESVKGIQEKYQSNDDPTFRERALMIKEQIFGQEHPDIAMTLNNLAVFYKASK